MVRVACLTGLVVAACACACAAPMDNARNRELDAYAATASAEKRDEVRSKRRRKPAKRSVAERARHADEALAREERAGAVRAILSCESSLPMHVEPELEGYDVVGLVAGWTREELVREACEAGAEAVVGLRTGDLGLSGIAVARPGHAVPVDSPPPIPQVAATEPPAVKQDPVPVAADPTPAGQPIEAPEYAPPSARPRATPRFKSEPIGPAVAALLSLFAIAGGIGGGALLVVIGGFELASYLVIAGVIVGPSVGLMAVRRHGRAWVQVGIHAGLYTAALVTLVIAAFAESTGMLVASAGLALGAVGVSIYSIVDGSMHAAQNREAWQAQRRGGFEGPYGWRFAPLFRKDGGGAMISYAF